MNSFRGARQRAADLHEKLVAGGVDPLDITALAEAATKDCQLEIVLLPAGHKQLKGAKGVLDPQSGDIYVEEGPSAIERAAIAAHEVGHACLHVEHLFCTEADTAGATAHPGSSRAGKLGDYGPHERRELEANVFARELLLPREFCRRLYLEQGMSVADICTATGLPGRLIKQQLLDALLLPPHPNPSGAPQAMNAVGLDPSQEAAVAHRSTPFQLIAGPGTGKTRTLIARILGLVADGELPESILVLTFSNKAAGEIMDRLQEALGENARKVWVGTFHSFGLDLVRRYYDRLDLPPDPPIYDRSDSIDALEELLPVLPLQHYYSLSDPAKVLKDVLVAISRAKDELIDPQAYRQLGEQMRSAAFASADPAAAEAADKSLEVATIYDEYQKMLRSHGAVDFGDLVMHPARLLANDAEVRQQVQERHRHVLVDEYQDVNYASVQLLKGIAGVGNRLWVVGDPRQSIYRFRGAAPANMSNFNADFTKAEQSRLEVNYRSTTEIVDAFVNFASSMGASRGILPLALEANTGDSNRPIYLTTAPTLEAEVDAIASNILARHKDGYSFSQQAVLCRTNSRLALIANGLEARGIPVLYLGSLFERSEIRDLLSLMSLVVERYAGGLIRVATMPRYQMSLEDVTAVIRHAQQNDLPPLGWLRPDTSIDSLSPEGLAALATLRQDLDSLPFESPWEFLSGYLLERSNIASDLATSQTAPDRMRAVAVWQFLEFLNQPAPKKAGHPVQQLLDRIRRLILLTEERDLRTVPDEAAHLDAVRLLTVHGSKGLEFDVVHLPGLSTSSVPSNKRPDRCPPPDGMISGYAGLTAKEARDVSHTDEEECLFFVALSRARQRLHLYRSETQKTQPRSPSHYLTRLGSKIKPAVAEPFASAIATEQSSQPRVRWPAQLTVSQTWLHSYNKCPRRFFYSYVVGILTAQRNSAFTRTHDCVHRLINWIGEHPEIGPADEAAVADEFERLWNERGPAGHAYADRYSALAYRMAQQLLAFKASAAISAAPHVNVPFASSATSIRVKGHDLTQVGGGPRTIRYVMTGRIPKKEDEELNATMYHLAGRQQFGSNYALEVVSLTTAERRVLETTDRKLQTRADKCKQMLYAMRRCEFPVNPDDMRCPRCPHFFICDATPGGEIDPKDT
ncbi:UvrD-helicase domain-containing protein [Paraburkholderia pallida]|uniref:DNA 3'-5' helicase n=1 Tax=Paraburkholderia pallida TaxID=2547399 RepID=A0A4V1B0E5_9BURK|nr:UvrD-helicase domain-containing protein [Paraburkholderia pallida]QBR02493.1 ImmA/IrrE family metallo-endopeptidase [Paraburkholderia pallida]